MEHHVEVGHPEGSSMATVKDLLEDLQMQPGMMQSELNAVTSLFTPSKLPSTGDNNLVVTTNIPLGSTSNVKTSDVNRELQEEIHFGAVKLLKAVRNTRLH